MVNFRRLYKTALRLFLVIAFAFGSFAVQGQDNNPPVVDNPLLDREVEEGFVADTVDLRGVFSDPDPGDTLRWSTVSSDTLVVTVSVADTLLILTEVGLGISTVVITATDSSDLSVNDTIQVTVNNVNDAPVVENSLPDRELDEYFEADTIDLRGVFSDQDPGDTLAWSAVSSDTTVVTVSVTDTLLILTEVGLGISTVVITATDSSDLSVNDTIQVTVNNVNDAPVVENSLPDRELDEYFEADTIDLRGVFSDQDPDDTLAWSAVSSDTTVVTVFVVDTMLTITEVGFGQSRVVITATDSSGLSVRDTINVTVNNVNDPPVVENSISDRTYEERFGTASFSIASVFRDKDNDDLSYLVVSSADSVVTVSLDGTTLAMTERGIGTSEITVTASDEEYSVDEVFTVTVNNVNDPPVLDNPLPDRELDEYFKADTVDLRGVFSDIDPDDTLAWSAVSSDTLVVTVSVADTLLILTEVGLGISTVVVTATDSSDLSVNDTIQVIVNNVNDAPVVENSLPDRELNEYFEADTVDLSGVFSDKDKDTLTFSVFSSNIDAVTVSVDGTTLIVTETGLGLSVVTVTASDGPSSIDESFSVTVNNVNDPPEVVNPIDDQILYEHFGNTVIRLEEVFSDPDSDVLLYRVESSDHTVVTVSVSGTNSLIITEQGLGTATIKVTADDTGFTESDAFEVVVNNVNDPPLLVQSIANQVVDENFGTLEIDLSGTFSDPDDDDLVVTATSSNRGVVTVGIAGFELIITEAGLGLSVITVTASDATFSVSTQFSVTVNNVNDAPVVSSPIQDRNYYEGFASSSFSVAPVFIDPDGDVVILSASSSDTSVVDVSTLGTTLTITETGLGVATVTVTADDGELSTDNQFTVTVNNVNDRPVLDQPIPDRQVDEHFVPIEIDLSNVFSDPDIGDVLAYSAVSDNNSVVEVSVAGATLTVAEAGLGTATITVTATDDGNGNLSNSDQFTITVNNVNDPPVVDNPVPDQTFNEHFGSETINLSATFSDPDAGTVLILSVVSSNPSVVSVSLSGAILNISETGLGTSTVTLTADDSVLSVDAQFTVTVNDVNDPPTVVATVPDQEVDEYFVSEEFDLSGVFDDPDEDVLTFTAESDDPGVVTVAVSGALLTVTEVGLGFANITVTASDGPLSSETGFIFTVRNVNDVPELTDTLPDWSIVENIGSAEIDLDSYFFDRDGDVLVYSVAMSDAGIVTYEQDQSLLVLQPAAVGSTVVTLTASDPGGLTAVDSFMVHVEKEYLLVVNYGSMRIQNKDTIRLCNDAGNITIRVNSKIRWDFTAGNFWIVVELNADSTLNLGFAGNYTGIDRTGTIRVFDVQGHSVEFYVRQSENCLTSIEEGLLSGMSLYPNPVGDKLYIDTGGRFEKVSRLEIIDFRGQLLYIERVEGDIAGMPLEIDMQSYTEGIYFVRITGDGSSFTGKIVKQ